MSKSAIEVLVQILAEATKVNTQEPRRFERVEQDWVERQGDLYIHRVADGHSHGQAFGSRQLVRGVTTGSRHEVAGKVSVFEGTTAPPKAPQALLGPLIVAEERFQITHPEHAVFDLPAGTYQVTHQRDAWTGGMVKD